MLNSSNSYEEIVAKAKKMNENAGKEKFKE
jgi:hypothetical protein